MAEYPPRDQTIDTLRGSAILFMIITHAIDLFYTGNSAFWNWWVWWGATVCFTIFLFVFAVLYGKKIMRNTIHTAKETRRIGILLAGYVGLGIYVQFFLNDADVGRTLTLIPRILTLTHLPKLTEFIPTFAWYIGLIAIFKKQLATIIGRFWIIAVCVSIGYVLARYLYLFDLGHPILNAIKAQLVGHEDMHSFGVLSYVPVFGLGLWWGAIRGQEPINQKILRRLASISLLCLVVLYATRWSEWGRWPPTILFLLYGLVYSFVAWWLFPVYATYIRPLVQYLSFIGKNAFIYYIGHILLIMPLSLIISTNRTSILPTLVVLAFVLVVIGGYSAWQQPKALTKQML